MLMYESKSKVIGVTPTPCFRVLVFLDKKCKHQQVWNKSKLGHNKITPLINTYKQ